MLHQERKTREVSEKHAVRCIHFEKVHGFGRLPERVRLASCSKLLQRLVYNHFEPLWSSIELREESWTMMQSMTDAMLSSLLVGVNARHVTRSMSLNASHENLRGFGLAVYKDLRFLHYVISFGIWI